MERIALDLLIYFYDDFHQISELIINLSITDFVIIILLSIIELLVCNNLKLSTTLLKIGAIYVTLNIN
jgi:hypothetical protein